MHGRPSHPIPRRHHTPAIPNRWRILGVLVLALLVTSIDHTIINVAMPRLVGDLGASSAQLQWVVAVVHRSCSPGCCSPPAASATASGAGTHCSPAWPRSSPAPSSPPPRLDDRAHRRPLRHGRRRRADHADHAVDPRQRVRRPPRTGQGDRRLDRRQRRRHRRSDPIVGGALMRSFSWSSVFWINVPLLVAAFVGALHLVPDSRDPHATRLDPVGAVLSIAAISSLVYAIIQAPERGWTSTSSLVNFAVGAAIADRVRRVGDAPRRPDARHRACSATAASPPAASPSPCCSSPWPAPCSCRRSTCSSSSTTRPLAAGFALVPAAIGMLLGTGAGAHLAAMHGGRIAVAAGTLIAAAGVAVQAAFVDGGSYVPTGVGLLLFGLGAGIAMPAATEMIMATLPPARAGVGSAVNDTVREFGGALGVAVIGSVAATSYATSMRGELDRFPTSPPPIAACSPTTSAPPSTTSRHLGAQGDQIAVGRPNRVRRLDEQLAVDRRRPRVLRRDRRPHPTPPPLGPTTRPTLRSPNSVITATRRHTGRPSDAPVCVVNTGGNVTSIRRRSTASVSCRRWPHRRHDAGLVLAEPGTGSPSSTTRPTATATVDEFHGFRTRDATAPNRFRAGRRCVNCDSYGVAVNGSTVIQRAGHLNARRC